MKRLLQVFSIISVVALLVACGGSDDPEPTPLPTATPPPTVSPGGTSVGQLFDQVNAAWSSVQSMQTTFWSTADGSVGTPPPIGEVTTETTIAPDRRHVVRTVDGVVVEEQIALSGRVFMRGQIVVAAIAPMMGPEAWVEVAPQAANSTAAIAAQVNWLLTPIQSPFVTVSAETRALEAFPGEPVEIDGRTCQTWTFGNPDGIEQELALDENNLPCRLIQRAGGVANVTLYVLNPAGASIVMPPVSTPTAP